MSKEISHEEIGERFVQAKVVDYAALGRFIAEFGPSLTVNDRGWHGVNFGRFNILACMMPAGDVNRAVGSLHGAALTASALEGALTSASPANQK